MNPQHTTADILKLDVTFFGENGVKQFLFGNGVPIASHVFNTLEEAFARFGKRIKIDSKAYVLSLNFKQGYAATVYAPRANADRVERIEYGMGYLKGLIDRGETARVPVKPVDMRMPHEVLNDQEKARKARVPQVRVPQTPNPAPQPYKAPPVIAPEPKDAIAARLEASRAALTAPMVITEPAGEPPAVDDMEIGDAPPPARADISASIGNIVKRGRGRPAKV